MNITFDNTSMTIAQALAHYQLQRSSGQYSIMGLVETTDTLWVLLYDGKDYLLVSGVDSLEIQTKEATKLLLRAVQRMKAPC